MFYCLDVHLYHLCGKSRFVCAHIGQKWDIYPPSIYGVHFDSYPLPLLRRLAVGAAIEKNFFYFFKTLTLTRQVFTRYSLSAFIFSRFILVWFWFRIYFISLRIMASIWFLDFIFSILYFDLFLLASISTCFSIVDSML